MIDPLTVGEVAARFGLTVRTLHHYDALGLLEPSEHSTAGYRLYTESDLARLQQIVVYRRLELPREEIRGLLEAGNPIDHLRRQNVRVMSRLDEMRELFGDSFDDYQAEAEEKWGDTDAWKQSRQRTATYTKDQWVQIKAEGEAVEKTLSDAFRARLPADSPEAMDAAEMHRAQVNKWFYDCSPEFHRNLGDLYVSDPRYVENYENSFELPGLAAWIRDAIHANADRQERNQ